MEHLVPRRSNVLWSTFVAAFVLLAGPALLCAQGVAGVVRDSVSRLPIAGAVLTLLDSSGATLARDLSNERGEYRFSGTRAVRAMRVVRIGFQPRSAAIALSPADYTQLDVDMVALPTMLQPARIIANANCSVRKDRAVALGLWEQARAGLLATIVAGEKNNASMHRLLFDRIMDGNSDKIVSMRVRADSDSAAASFIAAHPASDLVRFGFATDSTSNATYFGPDADVLLSDFFAGAYCFQLAGAAKDRPNQVGLHFVPAGRAKGRTDIDGTLWIDTVARELRDVEYRYLVVNRALEAYHSGGRVEFSSMRNGTVLIDRWSIRLVNAVEDTILEVGGRSGAFHTTERDRLFAEELGGELARASWPDGLTWHAPLGAFRLHAVTAAGKPAVGAIVALVATQYFGVVDSEGNVEIRDLVPGPYTVRIVDPRIAELGLGVPTPLKFTAFRDSTANEKLRVPTEEELLTDKCIAARQWSVGDSVFVVGRVVTPDGQPVHDAKVTFADGDQVWRSHFITTGTDGLFWSCQNWALGGEVTVRVHRQGAADVDVTRRFDSSVLAVKVMVPASP